MRLILTLNTLDVIIFLNKRTSKVKRKGKSGGVKKMRKLSRIGFIIKRGLQEEKVRELVRVRDFGKYKQVEVDYSEHPLTYKSEEKHVRN